MRVRGQHSPLSLLCITMILRVRRIFFEITMFPNNINGLFNDHKINRQLHLTAELSDVKMGEMSMANYLQKVKSLSDGLADLGSPVDDAEMVVHCLNSLSEQYESATDLISLMPGMTFAQCRSLLALKEICPRGNNKVIIYFLIS